MLPSFLQLPVQTTTARPSMVTSSNILTMDLKDETNCALLSSEHQQSHSKSISESGSESGSGYISEEDYTRTSTRYIDPILIESVYIPPIDLLTKSIWLKNIEGVPTYRGLTVFAIFIQHDNPLKLLYLIILWLCCLFNQICSILLSPLWIFLYEHVNIFELKSHENELNHWFLTSYILASTLSWIHIVLYWDCFTLNKHGSHSNTSATGNDDNWIQYETIQCGSTVYLGLLLYISILSGCMFPLCISRILHDTTLKKVLFLFITCCYVLVYLYLLTNAFVTNREFYEFNHEDYYLALLIVYMFFCSLFECLYELCWKSCCKSSRLTISKSMSNNENTHENSHDYSSIISNSTSTSSVDNEDININNKL